MRVVLTPVTSVLAIVAGYTALSVMRATPTIAAVHYEADESAGPALPTSLVGIFMLVVA